MLLEGLYFCNAADCHLRIYGNDVFCETNGCGQRLSYYSLFSVLSDGLDRNDRDESGKQGDGTDPGTACSQNMCIFWRQITVTVFFVSFCSMSLYCVAIFEKCDGKRHFFQQTVSSG